MDLQNALIHKVETTVDRWLKLTIFTRELSPQDTALLFMHYQQEVPTIKLPTTVEQKKSPSQRLRGVLYKLWEGQTSQYRDKFNNKFDNYYDTKMEELINHFKEQM